MIDLTPLEVRKKKGDFRRGMRGYDPQAVDDFLDLVADRLEQLVRENASMTERLARVEDQVGDYRERERALTEALVTAQEMREEMRKQIEREVDLKRREAEADAESIRSEAAQIREREEESIRRLRARQSQFVQSYRAFLERELSELAVMAESLDLNRSVTPSGSARKTRKRSEPEARKESAPEPAEPEPMPLPIAIPERTPIPEALALPETMSIPAPTPMPEASVMDFGEPYVKAADPEPAPRAASEAPMAAADRSIDDMLNELPPFAGTANVTQLEITEETTEETLVVQAPADDFVADPDEEAELLADVRAEFDELVAEDLPDLPEAATTDDEEVLDLVDDVADDEDEDGWMSTLLEGKGDQGAK